MKTRAYDEERHTMWSRLWQVVHGPVEVTPLEQRATLWAHLEALEAAAQELAALEDVEAARQARRNK